MARFLLRGWEFNDASGGPGAAHTLNLDGRFTGAGATIEGTIVRTGLRSLKIAAASATATLNGNTAGSLSAGYGRVYVRVTARPATTARLLIGLSTSAVPNIRLNPDGTLAVFDGGSLIGTSTTALTDTTKFYCVEWRAVAGTGVDLLWIDDVAQLTGNISSPFLSDVLGANDTVADTYTAYFDDFSLDDAARIGFGGKIVLLTPISDNARAALWVAGSNATTATTDLWEGVNNRPPVGTATSNAVTAAISHEGNADAATDDYDANMTTYTTAGIGASDTITAVRAVVVTAEDIATGAKLLTFSIKSNPAQGAFQTNFTAGPAAAGTYPTNWLVTWGTVIASPSVTLGTSPVMTVRRPETASRRADVCAMGIYVEYTPAVAQAFLAEPPLVLTHRAVHRASSW